MPLRIGRVRSGGAVVALHLRVLWAAPHQGATDH